MKNKVSFLFVLFLIGLNIPTAIAQTEKFEKAEVENSITFNANADNVWAYLSDLGNLENLVPSTIKHSITDGYGKGSTVTLTLVNNGKIVEKVTSFCERKRKISYIMIETSLPIQNYLATFSVKDIDDNRVKVTFTASFDVQKSNRKMRLDTFQNLQLELLENLKKFKGEK